jgi:hypothetical protein
MWTQIIFLLALLGIGIYLIRSDPSARHLALRRLTVFAALIAGAVVILSPGWLTALANLVGVGRGTDLLLYISILVFILYVISDYKKTVLLSRTNTELVRAVTLAEARLEDRIRDEKQR